MAKELTIPQRLEWLLKKRGVSQNALARVAKVSPQTVANTLRHGRLPQAKTTQKWARTLGVPTSVFSAKKLTDDELTKIIAAQSDWSFSEKKAVAKKPVAKKAVAAKKTVAKKPVAKKVVAKKPVAKKATVRTTAAAKRTTSTRTTARKPAARKSTATRGPVRGGMNSIDVNALITRLQTLSKSRKEEVAVAACGHLLSLSLSK